MLDDDLRFKGPNFRDFNFHGCMDFGDNTVLET